MKENEEILLVSQLIKSDKKAFDALYHKYSQKLFSFSFSLLKNEEDSKGIVQEVFLRVWSKRKEINSTKSFKSFLFTISYNLIIDHLRVKLKDTEYQKFLKDYFNASSISPSSYTDYKIINGMIKEAIDELPKKRKNIFVLSREKGYSHKEISEQMGISIKTVENQITLAIKHIKTKLGEDVFFITLFFSLFL
ncbi:RNA polymerase sigma-70 factor [Draconibacterium sp.]|nr:RNA polymerase sigma-70 factor [Draconibacterium sp.]